MSSKSKRRDINWRIPNKKFLSTAPFRFWWRQRIFLYPWWLLTQAGGIGLLFSGWIATGIALMFVHMPIRRLWLWAEVWRVEPRAVSRAKQIHELDSLFLPSRLSFRNGLPSIAALAIICVFLRAEHLTSWQWGLVASLATAGSFAVVYLSEFTPPFALFLGSSERSGDIFMKAVAGCSPHRAVTMLDVQHSVMIDRWQSRTYDSSRWQEIVRRLARIVCVVVLDGRHITPATSEESDWLLQEGLAYKLIVVGDLDGSCPLLEGSARKLRAVLGAEMVVVVNQFSLPSVLRQFTAGRAYVPTTKVPAHAVLATFISEE